MSFVSNISTKISDCCSIKSTSKEDADDFNLVSYVALIFIAIISVKYLAGDISKTLFKICSAGALVVFFVSKCAAQKIHRNIANMYGIVVA